VSACQLTQTRRGHRVGAGECVGRGDGVGEVQPAGEVEGRALRCRDPHAVDLGHLGIEEGVVVDEHLRMARAAIAREHDLDQLVHDGRPDSIGRE
jgi:hypothetical protein